MSLAAKIRAKSPKAETVVRKDVVGGYTPVIAGGYTAKILQAYLFQHSGGAIAANLELQLGERKFNQTLYVTKKTGENTYEDKNGNVRYMQGYEIINDALLIASGGDVSFDDAELDEKKIQLKNSEGQDVPTDVEILTQLIGQEIGILVSHERVNQQVLNPATNEYVNDPEGKTREQNAIAKVYDPESGCTVLEMMNENPVAVFKEDWIKQWGGKINDRTKQGTTGGASTGSPSASGGTETKKKSLFGGKK